ncbi:MAG: radical SAM family heme chaperone HemW [Chthoniobacterales bacterium]
MGEGTNDNSAAAGAVQHIYVHIPFCARICPYCAFYKERADPAQARRFCEALVAELGASLCTISPHVGASLWEARERPWPFPRASQREASTVGSPRLRPETIFFGGGTPTALTTDQLEYLLEGFQARLDLSGLKEWTFEANPGSVSERKANLLRARGVNRISLGVQSFDDGLLQLLGREHSAAQAEASFALLRRAGFENLNIDLMFGLPGQTIAQWDATLQRALALQPDHISAYCLTYEEDTEFFLRHARGEFRTDAEADADFFVRTDELLGAAGFEHYEVSNYARPGFESVHNQAYWSGSDYLGLGPSAVSTLGLRRWQNVSDYRIYADRLLGGESASTGDEILTPRMKRSESIALSLRTNWGIPAEWVLDRPDEVEEFVRLGLMLPQAERYVLTRRGRFLADSVAAAFI